MDQKKKIVVTIWLFSIVFLVLFFMLPAKADRYFLSSRILTNENKLVQSEAAEKKNVFQFFRNSSDDEQMLKMLQQRKHEDGKWLLIHLGIILFACNMMACLLYVFNMKPVKIIGLVMAYVLVCVFLVMQSLIRIHP